jgi:hypothetical protein
MSRTAAILVMAAATAVILLVIATSRKSGEATSTDVPLPAIGRIE